MSSNFKIKLFIFSAQCTPELKSTCGEIEKTEEDCKSCNNCPFCDGGAELCKDNCYQKVALCKVCFVDFYTGWFDFYTGNSPKCTPKLKEACGDIEPKIEDCKNCDVCHQCDNLGFLKYVFGGKNQKRGRALQLPARQFLTHNSVNWNLGFQPQPMRYYTGWFDEHIPSNRFLQPQIGFEPGTSLQDLEKKCSFCKGGVEKCKANCLAKVSKCKVCFIDFYTGWFDK